MRDKSPVSSGGPSDLALGVAGTIMWRARDNAAKGIAGLWTQGLRGLGSGGVGYDLTVEAIKRGANSGQFPSLKIVSLSPEFVFALDGIPFKFFRGDENKKATRRHAKASEIELLQCDLALGDKPVTPATAVNRLIIKTTKKCFPVHVWYARVTSDGKQHDKRKAKLVPYGAVDAAFEELTLPITASAAEPMKQPKATRKRKDVIDISSARGSKEA